MLFGSVIGGPMLYKTPTSRSSKIFAKRVFWRLRNQILDGHISGLEQDRDNLKPLLPTKSPTPYRLVPLANRSRDHTTSGLAFLTPHISPMGVPGAPKFFLVVGPEGAYLSSKHGVPPVTGRGGGIFQRHFGKKLGGKRGTSYRKN